MSALVVGVDPGPVPGVVVLCVEGPDPISPSIFQCDAGSVSWLVRESLSSALPWDQRILAIERFVVGPRAVRSSNPAAGRRTREMVGELIALGAGISGVRVVQRSASEVMPWATDVRLDRAGLLEPTKGMAHARAAARHALFAAVADGGAPDPLSRRGGERTPMLAEVCQFMNNFDNPVCSHRESGGVLCERIDPHSDGHAFGQHTIQHHRMGNGWACAAINPPLAGRA